MSGTTWLYAENLPAGDHRGATGLDQAIIPIVDALHDRLSNILLAPTTPHRGTASLPAPFDKRTELPPQIVTLADKALSRVTKMRLPLTSAWMYGAFRGRNASILVSILGSDLGAYVRADRLARRLGAKHIIYSVDDPIATMRLRDRSPTSLSISAKTFRTIISRSKIITISHALRDAYSTSYGIESIAIPLCYNETCVDSPLVDHQLIYIGNINEIYSSGLRTIIDAVDSLRADRFPDLTIRITSDEPTAVAQLGPLPGYVHCGRIPERANLAMAIAKSALAVCPIGFEPDNLLGRTSFPSKLLDYLAHSRQILVFGPINSSAVKYFTENGLAEVHTDPCNVKKTILEMIETQQDHRVEYRRALAKNHGATNFRAAFDAYASL